MSVAEVGPGKRMLHRPELRLVTEEPAHLDDAGSSYEGIEAYQTTPWVFSDDFPRDRNGLIDIAVYDEFLVDNPDTIPPIVRNADQKGLRHQHEYFWRSFFRQRDVPREMRDQMLKRFWSSPYNQILMRIKQERRVHEKHKKLVSPPPIETMRDSLVDFDALDSVGAAAVGRRVALVPEAFEAIEEEVNEDIGAHPLTTEQSPAAIAAIFDEEMGEALAHLENPLVTPQRVITGAISRMARLTNNERLIAEARRRVKEDPKFYPVRIRDPEALLVISRKLLNKHLLRAVSEPPATLQTGVD